jgi:tetratricopeptide (TPR) repeat protein
MGKALVDRLLPALQGMEWPEIPASTGLGRQTYEMGIEQVSTSQGDARSLIAALKTFQSGDSEPYAFAGVAYTLLTAAREKDGSYASSGLDGAMSWLEKAQATEPDLVEINVIEALAYTYRDNFEDARLVLDYLHQQDPSNYYVHLAEVIYWQRQNNDEQVEHWYQQTVEEVVTIPQRLRLRSQLGDYYWESGNLEKALEIYEESVRLNKEDARMWHKLSVLHWRMQNLEEAERCNRMALRYQNLPAARKLEAAIKEAAKKRNADQGIGKRLFGG